MSELTATVAETRANFSRVAGSVCETGKPVTVFKNSKPWVVIAPVNKGYGDHIPLIDWSKKKVIEPDPTTGLTVLPQEWDSPEDEGLYDGMV